MEFKIDEQVRTKTERAEAIGFTIEDVERSASILGVSIDQSHIRRATTR